MSRKKRSNPVVRNIVQQKFLLSLFVVSLVATIVYPLRSYLVVLPFFSDKLLEYSEDEARKTANFLTKELLDVEGDSLVVSDNIEQLMPEVMEKFGLEKVKIFLASGLVIYSTDADDIGKINQNEYFHLIVAKGEAFSKIVAKDQRTLEGRVAVRDVAEIYVPVMQEGKFLGAFELYYDLTIRKQELDGLLWQEATLGTLISFLLLGVVCIVLYRASRLSLQQKAAENELRRINFNLEEIVAVKTKEIAVTQEASIHSLAILAESYDPDTGEHINRIRRITHILATLLKEESAYAEYLQERGGYIEDLALASILHDIGKTSIPKEILGKPGKLTREEFEFVKTHTSVAGSVLRAGNQLFVDQFGKDSYLALAGDIAMYHHEKWDGSGYPKGLSGEDIPLSARIVAVADVYDALRSERPYKEAWSHEKTVQTILADSGKQFDPEVMRIFEKHHHLFRDVAVE